MSARDSRPIKMVEIDGKHHRVQRIPMSTGKSKFKNKSLDPSKNHESVIERFHNSNNSVHRSL